MDLKTFFALLATTIGAIAYIPYFKDVISHKTQPHPFTWLIFAITQATAAGIIWQDGGDKGSLLLVIGAVLTIIILLLSLPNSKKIITKSDMLVLAFALVAIVIWRLLENPLLAILLLSIIDASGYIPTFRKSYLNPRNETISLWAAFAVADIFAILALGNYSLITLSFLVTITSANIALVIFLMIRRKQTS
jgi:hypothetical protein